MIIFFFYHKKLWMNLKTSLGPQFEYGFTQRSKQQQCTGLLLHMPLKWIKTMGKKYTSKDCLSTTKLVYYSAAVAHKNSRHKTVKIRQALLISFILTALPQAPHIPFPTTTRPPSYSSPDLKGKFKISHIQASSAVRCWHPSVSGQWTPDSKWSFCAERGKKDIWEHFYRSC